MKEMKEHMNYSTVWRNLFSEFSLKIQTTSTVYNFGSKTSKTRRSAKKNWFDTDWWKGQGNFLIKKL